MVSGADKPDSEVDVIVIGGGVNGTGVARDCALRGLRVALFERNDLAFGASGNSTGMIHGGPRYLASDPDVTRDCCLDSGHIQRIAPHLLFRVPCLLTVPKSRLRAGLALSMYDAVFELYDRYQPLKRGKPHVRLSGDELRQLEPGLAGELAGGISFDEWGIDGVRLCIGNAVDAVERGARIYTHCTVTRVLRRPDGSVCGVRYRDLITGHGGECAGRVVVNATGAWAPLTATLGGLGAEQARVRPGKGIHVYFDRRLTNYAVVVRAIDGRQVFLLPWQNMTVIGSTDDDYYGDLDRVLATTDEVRYLLQAVERVFPDIRHARALGTWAAVRPTLYEWGVNEDELSRDHRIVEHAQHGADGLYSMIGGKLASYRMFAEELTDRIVRRLGRRASCQTHAVALPGGDEQLDVFELARRGGISATAATRLHYRHGSRAARIIERMVSDPREAALVCVCEPVTEAEIRYVTEHELARSVDDVSRRTRLGLGSCGGMRCAGRCGSIVADLTARSAEEGHEMAREFLRTARARRLPALGPTQAQQEALVLAATRSELGCGVEGETAGASCAEVAPAGRPT
jgi:glycerol-3-phosphate dehydrogenase